MAWLMSLLGAALALAGGISLWNGISYIRLDWGQTETVAGTMALSSGIVTFGLGAVLFALRDLQRRPARSASSGVGVEALTVADDEPDATPRPVGRFASRLTTMGMPRTEPNAPGAIGREAGSVEPIAVETGPLVPTAQRLDAAERDVPSPALRPGFDTAPLPGARPEPEMLPDPRYHPSAGSFDDQAAFAEAPTVVGRYEANGASYVLFSDGTIEVETESGTHRFSSMAELKEHIERQDAV